MMRTCLFVLLVVVGISCQRESNIKIPYDGEKIVVNSLIQPDSLIYIRVTGSKPVQASGNLTFPELSNAIVSLYEDDILLPAPHWQVINGRGYFVSENMAGTGRHYSMNVTSEGLADVSAADSTPMPPVIKNAQAQASINRIRFTLSDDVTETNYYRIRFFNADTVNGVLIKNKTDTIRSRLDPSIGANFIDIIGDNYYTEVIVSDERINGKDYEFVMQTEKVIQSAYMIVEVSGLSKGAYDYLHATNVQRQDDESEFVLDPVNVYSNVQNGYGIVAGVNARTLGFKVR